MVSLTSHESRVKIINLKISHEFRITSGSSRQGCGFNGVKVPCQQLTGSVD
jgi:hypothetical protein